MAGQIKGMTIEIGGNTAPLEQALKDTNKEINSTQKELREVNKLLKLDPENVTLLKQKQELLTEAIGKTTTKLDALKQAQAQLNETMKNGGEVNQSEYRKLEREIATTESSLAKLKAESKKTGDQMNKSSVDVKRMADATKKVGEVAVTATKALIDFTNMGIKVMAGAIVTATATITKLATDAGKLADELNTLASQTGLSTQKLQEFQYASELIDVDVNTLAGALKKTTSAMSKARDGTGSSAEAFEKLGVNIKNVDGSLRDNEDVFNDSIRALGNIANETERDAIAMELFGKSATELNPLIEGGIDTLDEMSQKANELGLILSQDAVDSANKFNDQLDIMKANGKGLFNVIGAELASSFLPTMEEANATTEGYIKRLTDAMSKGGLEGLLEEAGNVVGDLVTKISEKIPKFAELGVKIVKSLVEGIKNNAQTIGEGGATLYTTLVEGFYSILPDLIDTAITLVTAFITSIGNKLPELIPIVVTGLLGVVDAIVSNIDKIIDAGMSILEGLAKGVLASLPILIEKVPIILEKFTTALLEMLPTLYETYTEIFEAVIDFITNGDNLLLLVNTAITLVTTMATALIDNLPLIITAIIDMYTTCIKELVTEENIELMINTIIQIITLLADALITNLPLILEKLPPMIMQIASALMELAPVLLQAGLTIIVTIAKELFEKLKSVGGNLVKGLWEGIAGFKDWIIRKIRSLCKEMLSAIQDFFGIESPSRVMADEVGKFMAQGIGVGFGNTMPSVMKAMKEKLSTVTDAMQTQLSFGDIPQIQGNQIVSENSYVTKNFTNTTEIVRQPQVVELVLDGTKVARTLVQPLNNEYNRLGMKI